MGEGQAFEELFLVDFLGPGLDHDDAVLVADDGHVDGAAVELDVGRVDDVLAVDEADLDRAEGRREGDVGEVQGGRGADDAERVGLVLEVGREEQADDLGVEEVALGEERPDGTVDQAGDQDLPLRGPAFALEEATGDLAGGVGVLAVVDDEREEVLAFLELLAGGGRHQHHRVAVAKQGRAVGLLGDPADLDGQGPLVDLWTDSVGHGVFLWWPGLLAQAELLDELLVAADIVFLDGFEEPLSLPDQLHEAGVGVEILLVVAEMLDEQVDPLRQQGHLDLRRARIGRVGLVLLDDFVFCSSC